MDAIRSQFVENRLKPRLELRQLSLYDSPDDICIDLKIFVDQDVSHSYD